MAYSKQVWTARVGNGLNRFRDTVSGNYLELVNVPSMIVTQGTPFSAERMNHIEEGLYAVSLAVEGGGSAGAVGSSTFNGTAGRSITHAVGSTDYAVCVTPAAATNGTLGEFYVIKSADKFTVYNTGSFRGAFDYVLSRRNV